VIGPKSDRFVHFRRGTFRWGICNGSNSSALGAPSAWTSFRWRLGPSEWY
jgi:hypothetical protein